MKERIIGAVVLVVFAVLVVPVFLDGPSDEQEIVSQSVMLPGQDTEERKRQTIVLERDREQPVPASQLPAPTQAAPVVREEASTPARDAEKPVEKPAEEKAQKTEQPAAASVSTASSAPAAAEPVAESATGMFAVQLGSFSSQENAERLAADLRSQGYAAFLSQTTSGDRQLHRVRVGPQKDRESAEAVAAQLAKTGHSGQVVPHP
jgi:DedD protein